ncbi:ATP-binding cassette domain-containing protein [Aurantiacibacter poecillastricola]|uniref:ATP-binding cassette domain-containing protein n=1 Tax=Aurantiacibacter poecillastricola TaxID=3064385 RepID=UPI00273FE479|nr:ATP-binding cassette domain-containing protein [Aurantiacibacter sp. 219JJ12-13]MDP5261137.1 ATP-binding cassette domain-containing protein [Aurantiacibacter sp. 219JJ12-13]
MFFDVDITMLVDDHAFTLQFVSDARLTALVGPSGVGKTSTLNAIAGLLRPRSGRIVVAGDVLFDSAADVDLPPEKRSAGYVFQDARLFPHKTVAANLAYGERLSAHSGSLISRDEVVRLLEIEHLLHRLPATLSGGEARRVAIGRALLSSPRFLLLDEPLSSLDESRAETLLVLIERLRDEIDLPMLLVSHSSAEVERLAGRVVTMTAHGPPGKP